MFALSLRWESSYFSCWSSPPSLWCCMQNLIMQKSEETRAILSSTRVLLLLLNERERENSNFNVAALRVVLATLCWLQIEIWFKFNSMFHCCHRTIVEIIKFSCLIACSRYEAAFHSDISLFNDTNTSSMSKMNDKGWGNPVDVENTRKKSEENQKHFWNINLFSRADGENLPIVKLFFLVCAKAGNGFKSFQSLRYEKGFTWSISIQASDSKCLNHRTIESSVSEIW